MIILGHPLKDSFCGALAREYAKGASEKNSEVKIIHLGDLKFDPVLKAGYKKIQELEPDLKEVQKMIEWADHLTFVYPIWWANVPSLLKGLIDRTFLPGFAYKFKGNSLRWDKYLKGKTFRLMATSDSPPIFYRSIVGDPDRKAMKDVLSFCGVKMKGKSYFGSIKLSNDKKRKKWISRARNLGKKD